VKKKNKKLLSKLLLLPCAAIAFVND